MSKQVMRRRAADNVYLHKDFHAALNRALIFVEARYGEEAVREYLRRFAAVFFAPLREEIGRRGEKGGSEIRAHLQSIFEREGGGADISRDEGDIVVRVFRCPAVSHIRKLGESVSPLFFETTRTVNTEICDGTGWRFSFDAVDCPGGTCVQRFSRRRS